MTFTINMSGLRNHHSMILQFLYVKPFSLLHSVNLTESTLIEIKVQGIEIILVIFFGKQKSDAY